MGAGHGSDFPLTSENEKLPARSGLTFAYEIFLLSPFPHLPDKGNRHMNIRRLTSLTAFISFFVVILTSIILYIVPHGRVAYWADWHLWGLTKEEWGALHINTGFLFLLFLVLHIYYNWKPITIYLKDKSQNLKIFTGEFNAALIITVVVMTGTYFEIPPFKTIISVSDWFKEAASEKYGEPPYGHAELSTLVSFSQKMNMDAKKAIRLLQDAGYSPVSGTMTLKDIARIKNVPPVEVYKIMQPAERSWDMTGGQDAFSMPENPPPGTGNLALSSLCEKYHLKTGKILKGLSQLGVDAEREETLKRIAEKHGMNPVDLYGKIRDVAKENF